MRTGSPLLVFFVATLLLLIVPGPSLLYVIARSVEQGTRAGLWSVLGLETGVMLYVGATGVGLTALLASSPLAFAVVRYGGAAYLLWLGLHGLLRPKTATAEVAQPECEPQRLFRHGVVVELLNPKTGVFFLAFLPQFVDPGRGSVSGQLLILGLVFVALAVVCDGSYAICAGGLARRLRGSPRAQRHLGAATGGVYVVLAGMAAFAHA